jgi:hypothetical protein
MSDYKNMLEQAKSMEKRAKQHYVLYKRLKRYASTLRKQAEKLKNKGGKIVTTTD